MSDRPGEQPTSDLVEALSQQLDEQRQRVELLQLNTAVPAEALEESLLEISVAHEELRVAQEELRAQQKAIEDLLDQQRTHGVWRERVSSLLPVPVFVTDSYGTVLDANSVAAAIIGVAEPGLLRRPLTSFVSEPDRNPLRQIISQLQDHTEQQLLVVLVPRRGDPIQVTMAGFNDPGPANTDHRYRWVAVPTKQLDIETPVDQSEDSAGVFAKLCRLPIEDDDPRDLLSRVAALGVKAIPHATGLSVSLGSPIEPDAMATESEFAQAVDGAQWEAEEGPCIEAYEKGAITVSQNIPSDRRWPIFAGKASAAGLGSALAVPLQRGPETIGVLNLYAESTEAFDSHDIRIAGLFGAAVGAVVEDVRERDGLRRIGEQLKEALGSRAEIDQAKGIIMARQGCTADEAFARLVTVSRNTNTKLSDLSSRLVQGATLPRSTTR